jgi:hypothetical protein
MTEIAGGQQQEASILAQLFQRLETAFMIGGFSGITPGPVHGLIPTQAEVDAIKADAIEINQ